MVEYIPMVSDDNTQSQNNAVLADEEVADQESVLGHAPEEVEDIDATLESVGLPSDDNGPHELNSGKVIEEADQNH